MAEGINTTSISLPTSVSDQIFAKAQEQSVIMQLAQPIELPGNGLTIPVVTGDPEVDWASETDEKTVSEHTLQTKDMKGYTLAVIEPFSNQFRDNNEALYEELVNRLPALLAKKFDQTCFFGAAPGTGFDTLADATAIDISTKTYDGFVDAIDSVSDADAELDGWALSPKARTILLKAKDSQNRPLFISNAAVDGGINSVLSIPATFSKAAAKDKVVGFGGDWTGARYGIVKSVDISVSDQATLTSGEKTLNLWQRNMFAVRAEFEVGFVVRDTAEFVKLTNGATA